MATGQQDPLPLSTIAAIAARAAEREGGGSGGGVITLIANDEDITVPAFNGTTVVLYTAVTAERFVNLPPASGPAQIVVVMDVNGQATNEFDIEFVAAGADTITANAIGTPDGGAGGEGVAVVNDGVSNWCAPFEVSPTLNQVRRTMQGIADSLGGTDGDGNVYSVDFNPESQQLAFKCVTAGGDTWLTFVSAGSAGLAFLPAEGDPLTLTLENEGVKINGVVIDPNEPWPGG